METPPKIDLAANPALVLRQVVAAQGFELTPDADRYLSEMERWLDEPGFGVDGS